MSSLWKTLYQSDVGNWLARIVAFRLYRSSIVCKHCRTVFLRHEVLLQMEIELRLSIAARITLDVFLIQQLACHMQFRIGKLLAKIRQSCQEIRHARVAVSRRAGMEHALQLRVVLGQIRLTSFTVPAMGVLVILFFPVQK